MNFLNFNLSLKPQMKMERLKLGMEEAYCGGVDTKRPFSGQTTYNTTFSTNG